MSGMKIINETRKTQPRRCRGRTLSLESVTEEESQDISRFMSQLPEVNSDNLISIFTSVEMQELCF